MTTSDNLHIDKISKLLRGYAHEYNSPEYFTEDPIIFPKHFAGLYKEGKATLQDIECSAVISAHLAWGRRSMIVRDCNRAFDQMQWRPFEYIMSGIYKDDETSLHRTIKWSDFAAICGRLKEFYSQHDTLEILSADQMRVKIYGQKSDPNGANKKIHMLRRWLVRDDGVVDLGIWKNIDKKDLIIPLDVHVHRSALQLGITLRKSADFKTALEITEFLRKVFPDDPTMGDFALFAVSCVQSGIK